MIQFVKPCRERCAAEAVDQVQGVDQEMEGEARRSQRPFRTPGGEGPCLALRLAAARPQVHSQLLLRLRHAQGTTAVNESTDCGSGIGRNVQSGIPCPLLKDRNELVPWTRCSWRGLGRDGLPSALSRPVTEHDHFTTFCMFFLKFQSVKPCVWIEIVP